MTSIAIVGGGVAGLATAYALRDADAEVTVYERRDSVGGRAATRRKAGSVYDVGANYVKDEDERIADLISEELADGLVEIEERVWTFDAEGEISEGRDDQNRKWTYREGLAELGKRLREASGVTVRTESEVVSLARAGEAHGDGVDGGEGADGGVGVGGGESADGKDGWQLQVRGGTETADVVVLTPPAPVTAYLLDRSEWDGELCSDLRDAAAGVPYRTLLSVALHYPKAVETPYYALVNTDKEHDLGWVGREECKPGHVPDGESLLVVQPSPEWSRDRYDDPDDDIAIDAADQIAELLGDPDLYQFDWADVVRWRDALPDAGADSDVLARGGDLGLFFAGDWVVGEGRIHAALRSGLETGERVRETV